MPAARAPRIASHGDHAACADPIDILAAEHAVLRAACASLEFVAAATRPEPEAAKGIAAQLRAVLPRHMADEGNFLFPLLCERADPDDEIERVFARLALEHGEGGARLQEILALLDRLARTDSAANPAEQAAMGAFAAATLRHLGLESAIVLPIARERLSAADRAALRTMMSDRNPIETVTP